MVAGWPDRVLDTVTTVATGGLAILGVILSGTYLYYRQGITLARRLLTAGHARAGEVVGLSRSALGGGLTVIDVRVGGQETVRFLHGLSDAERAALEKAPALVIESGGDRAVYLPRIGLVTTR